MWMVVEDAPRANTGLGWASGEFMPPEKLAREAKVADDLLMLNVLSLIVGAVALLLGILAFFPLLGWAYWLIIPIALVGLGLGVVSRRTSGRNLNLVVIVVGVIRLMLGGGII